MLQRRSLSSPAAEFIFAQLSLHFALDPGFTEIIEVGGSVEAVCESRNVCRDSVRLETCDASGVVVDCLGMLRPKGFNIDSTCGLKTDLDSLFVVVDAISTGTGLGHPPELLGSQVYGPLELGNKVVLRNVVSHAIKEL